MKFKMESLDSSAGYMCFKCRRDPHFSMSIKGKDVDVSVKVCSLCHIKNFKDVMQQIASEGTNE